MILLDVPNEPENVEAIGQSGSTMLIKWETLGNSNLPVTSQVVYGRIVNNEENPGRWFKATTTPTVLTDENGALVENLFPYTFYQFRVRASNIMGQGRFSEASEPKRTLEGSKFFFFSNKIFKCINQKGMLYPIQLSDPN